MTRRPNTFSVGAASCATTAHGTWLSAHPEVFMASRKDLHYFGSDLKFRAPRLDEAAYLSHFEDAGECACVAESSVWYLYSQQAAAEIARFQPNARIVIALRNPIEVIAAHHSQMRLNGLGDEDIQDLASALDAETDRRRGLRIPDNCSFPKALLYRDVVRFSEQIHRFIEQFPREQIHLVLHDDLAEDPESTYRALLTFLGVDNTQRVSFHAINPNQEVRSATLRWLVGATPQSWKSALPATVRMPVRHLLRRANQRTVPRRPISLELQRDLMRELTPEIKALAKLIERDLTHWTAATP